MGVDDRLTTTACLKIPLGNGDNWNITSLPRKTIVFSSDDFHSDVQSALSLTF